MLQRLFHIFPAIALISILCACGNEIETPGILPEDDGIIYVTRQAVTTADDIGDDDNDDSAPIITNSFEAGDLLYFSQMPQGLNPNFTDTLASAPNYLYIYEYQDNLDASWASEFNFKVWGNRRSFNWDDVIGVGPNGNAFKFFGFFFPIKQKPVWSVETDQSDPDTTAFKSSDIMGAYHSTSAIFTRMRFRLYHLMTYLKVTVYVPVYQGDNSSSDMSYSGFNEGAMQGGYMMNIIKDFSIEWATAKSSDTEPPMVQVSGNAERSNIKMFAHHSDETESEIEINNYYGGQVDGITDGKDTVRTYNFSVLFPTQIRQGSQGIVDSDNFLCFSLVTPGGDKKYYYFYSSQIKGADGNSFGLTQGTLQQLYLYLPRKTNQSVLVGAKILPWQEGITDMTVNKQSNGQ